MADVIKTTYKGRVATITIDNDKKLNALDLEGYYNLSRAMREVAQREGIYITVLTGKGRYFSAGADVKFTRPTVGGDVDIHETYLRGFVANNLNITQTFSSHPKILIVALNGPAIGLSAALTAFGDFVYCTPSTFLLTPFSSLGLVAEGGSSHAFVERLGISKANEALIMSKRITCEELVQTGYVNKVFDVPEGFVSGNDSNSDAFLEMVYKEIDDRLGGHLVGDSLTGIKALIRRPGREVLERQNVAEVFAGLERFVTGIPQQEFAKIASGQKRHKL